MSETEEMQSRINILNEELLSGTLTSNQKRKKTQEVISLSNRLSCGKVDSNGKKI